MHTTARQHVKRLHRRGWSLSVGLLLIGGLGVLAAWRGDRLRQIAWQAITTATPELRWIGSVLFPIVSIALSLLALFLVATMVRRTWWRSQQATAARAATSAAHQAQEAVLEQLRMLEHAHLKSAVLEAQTLLNAAQESISAEQRALRLQDVGHSLNRLYRLVVELHGQVTQKLTPDAEGLAHSALPNDLERTLQEVTRNYRALIPRCTLEIAGQPSATIAPGVRHALMMVLYNALANAQRHGQAQSVRVRLEYRLEAIVLTVQDDGRGFDVTEARRNGGRGLHDMHALAQQHGGDIDISSVLGQGTEIVLTLPLIRPQLGWAAGTEDDREFADDRIDADSAVEARPDTRASVAAGAHDSSGGRYGDYARTGARPADPPWLPRDRR